MTPPLASSLALPAVMRTASRISSRFSSSSMMMSAPAASAWRSSSRLSTSISTGLPGAMRCAAATAAATPPLAAMWFSLIRKASYRPMRWLSQPPQVTAYFCARRRPGRVLRVSSRRTWVPSTRSARKRARVATPDSICRKFSALRSPLSSERAGPSRWNSGWLAVARSPSATCQCTATRGSSWRNTASTHAVPAITQSSRVMMVALARRSAGISCAVISPLPMSSNSARRTLASISAVRSARRRFGMVGSTS
ncbi:hypothetical protein D3C81_448640 [compost metagenome]